MMRRARRRSLTARWGGLVLAVCGVACAPRGAAQGTKFATEVPLLDCDGTPCVEARIGPGKAVRMGIDTGNVASVVDTDLAKAAALKPVGEMPPGAPAGVFQTSIPAVEIGEVKLTGVPALALGLGNMISRGEMPHVAGTLAYTAFRDRILQLDFVAHKVRISEALKSPVACEGTCDKISLIHFGNEGPPIVVATGFSINEASDGADRYDVYGNDADFSDGRGETGAWCGGEK